MGRESAGRNLVLVDRSQQELWPTSQMVNSNRLSYFELMTPIFRGAEFSFGETFQSTLAECKKLFQKPKSSRQSAVSLDEFLSVQIARMNIDFVRQQVRHIDGCGAVKARVRDAIGMVMVAMASTVRLLMPHNPSKYAPTSACEIPSSCSSLRIARSHAPA